MLQGAPIPRMAKVAPLRLAQAGPAIAPSAAPAEQPIVWPSLTQSPPFSDISSLDDVRDRRVGLQTGSLGPRRGSAGELSLREEQLVQTSF
jgi:hypothetical protein